MTPEMLMTGGLVGLFVFCVFIAPGLCKNAFKAGENVSTEGTVYIRQIRYKVELVDAPVYTHVIMALRTHRKELPVSTIKRRVTSGTLGWDLTVHEVKDMVNALHKHAPSCKIEISSTSFEKTFTMQQWKEFHDGK
jgi:hypothetical protein